MQHEHKKFSLCVRERSKVKAKLSKKEREGIIISNGKSSTGGVTNFDKCLGTEITLPMTLKASEVTGSSSFPYTDSITLSK